jgi:hypothetical protein
MNSKARITAAIANVTKDISGSKGTIGGMHAELQMALTVVFCS